MISRKNKLYFKADLHTKMGYAIVANAKKFREHRHAYQVWKFLMDCGCKVYPVAAGLERFEGRKIYSGLEELKGKIDVVIPCLMSEHIPDIVLKTADIGAKYIWFQEKNWTPVFQEQCEQLKVMAVRGCCLKHRVYKKPLAFLNPCYWHGLKESKVPKRFS